MPPNSAAHDILSALEPDIDELELAPRAKAAALALKRAHPTVIITSGRRSAPDQARAMAGNIARNRQWIAQTYVSHAESRALQAWVDAHPQARTRDTIAAGLLSVMNSWTDAQKGRLSKHFSGEAFDIRPVAGAAGAEIKRTIRALPGLTKFLEREGGLIIWHAQF
ncbi:hypothetical protein [Caulobacter mirabilis]|uniref:Uncharacterized protein n=1 Tax=Caulobacter mirabilis TaxID=69666 RepID=A0A2D2AZV8_9CAUL|nr:hypothetical protein [Caulobacter mirabilis]ATQ43532.1 hypothetical protein CSW64_14520 [Caulobacter mirabilis]